MLNALLLLFLVVSIVNQFARIPLGNGVVVNVLDILVFVTLVGAGVIHVFKRDIFSFPPIILRLHILFVLYALGVLVLFNPLSLSLEQIGISSLYLFRWFMYTLLLYLLIPRSSATKMKVHKYMLLVGIALVSIGYLQYVFYPDLRNLYYLGWDDHLQRMFSTFLDPNFAGAFFVLFFLYLLAFVQDLQKKSVLFAGLAALCVIAVFLTYSRTGVVMLLVGVAMYFLLQKRYKLLFASVLVAVAGVFTFFNTGLEGQNFFRVASTMARLESVQDAMSIVREYPLTGVGFNAYKYAQLKLGFREESSLVESHALAGTDNSYLFLMATTGVIGLILFVIYWATLIRSIMRKERSNRALKRTVLASVAAIIVGTLFINLLFYPPILVWMIVLLGTTQHTEL